MPSIHEERTQYIPDFPFASTGRDRNKHDAHFLQFYCTENLNQIELSQPFDIPKTSKNIAKILSLSPDNFFFFFLVNFITNNHAQFRLIYPFSSNIWANGKFSKEITIFTVFPKFQAIVLSLSTYLWITIEDYSFPLRISKIGNSYRISAIIFFTIKS